MITRLHKLGVKEITYGMRTAFSAWACSRTNPDGSRKYDPAFVDWCLSHDSRSRVQKAYQRDEHDVPELRRPIFDAWADYCAGTITNP